MGRGDSKTTTQQVASRSVDGFPTFEEINAADVRQVLSWNRFLPSPQNEEQVEKIDLLVKRLSELRAQDNDAYVRASKSIGWGSPS